MATERAMGRLRDGVERRGGELGRRGGRRGVRRRPGWRGEAARRRPMATTHGRRGEGASGSSFLTCELGAAEERQGLLGDRSGRSGGGRSGERAVAEARGA